MKTIAPTSLALILSLASLEQASCAILFQDTFDSGTGAWYKAGSSGTLSNAGGALSWSESGSGINEVIGRAIPTTTVAVGETLRLTYTIVPAASNAIHRTGFYNMNGTISQDGWGFGANALTGSYNGYNSFFRINGATTHAARSDSGSLTTDTSGTGNGPLQAGTSLSGVSGDATAFTATAGNTYTVTYELTRTGANSVTTTYTLNDGTSNVLQVSGSSGSASNFTFNAITLRQTEGLLLYDNITLELIPEPSATALSLLGAAGLLLPRRRKN